MNNSYQQTKTGDSFNWHYALDNPEKFNQKDLEDKAGDWITCACGNQCHVIPRFWNSSLFCSQGCPLDNELEVLGSNFLYEVESENWEDAKDILRQIEIRSQYLIDLHFRTSFIPELPLLLL